MSGRKPVPYSASSRTSTGGITGSKPLPPSTLQRPAHERELEQHERPLEVREARAGHARARLHVDEAAEQLEVVAAGLARLADLAHHLVLVGRRRVGRVRHARERGLQLLLDVADLGLELLHLGGDAAHLLDRGRRVAARALRLGDLVVRRVLRRAQLLEPREHLAPALVELQELVEHVRGAAARERGADRLRVAPDLL